MFMRFTRRTRLGTRSVALAAALGLLLAACGGEVADDTEGDETGAGSEDADAADDAQAGDRLHIVATTSILGDIVGQLVGDDAEVTVIMPPGADPHAYEPSAQDGAILREADLVVANGLMLEENLVSALEAVEDEGGNIFELADELDPIDFDWDGPDDHGHDDDDHGHDDDDHGHSHDDDDHGHDDDDHGHDDDDHGHDDDDHGHDDHDDHGHSHDEDPHVWFDPIRMGDGVGMIAAEIAAVDTTLDAAEWDARAEAYVAELMEVHEEMEAMFAEIAEEDRQLVTNHDALGYLAVRYDFEVLGTVIPGSSTQADADPRGFSELIATVEEADVPAVFAENTDSTVLAEQLASEVIGRSDLQIEVVRIYTDALGDEGSGAETYLGLLRTTSELITEALT
jgi:zinc/manganese transport system substrate-binding protein